MIDGADQLVVALDVEDVTSAQRLRSEIGDAARWFKVGIELFAAAGPEAVRVVGDRSCFLDLKLHDIPETVGRAVRRLVGLEQVAMLTVHAAGGAEMMRRAVSEAQRARVAVLAVTVLTSLDAADLTEVGDSQIVEDLVLKRAHLAHDAGCDGVVASPREVARLRAALPPDFKIVTPGIRPAESAENADQKRVASARDAIRAGASLVVVGRPIRDASIPRQAAAALCAEIVRARTA